jgi:hypothetical protein
LAVFPEPGRAAPLLRPAGSDGCGAAFAFRKTTQQGRSASVSPPRLANQTYSYSVNPIPLVQTHSCSSIPAQASRPVTPTPATAPVPAASGKSDRHSLLDFSRCLHSSPKRGLGTSRRRGSHRSSPLLPQFWCSGEDFDSLFIQRLTRIVYRHDLAANPDDLASTCEFTNSQD